MRVIAFPPRRASGVDAAALAELEAAFDGDGSGPEAEAWRELRADVRSLSEPIDPAFRSSLEQQLRGTREQPARGAGRASRWLHGAGAGRRRVLALGAALALLVALVVAGAELSSGGTHGQAGTSVEAAGPTAAPSAKTHSAKTNGELQPVPSGKTQGTLHGAEAQSTAPKVQAAPEQSVAGAAQSSAASSGEAPGERSGRLQQLSAAISLGAQSGGVQALADRVGQLAVAVGGFVESSKVELQHGSAGEATLTLKLPSARLANALARLQRLAPVRAETQELQDLTGSYDALAGRLSAARAERDALLRALARAQTAAALESLHQRIAQADGEIAALERQQASISRSASQAQVEVTVLGEATHTTRSSGGLTLGRGAHDAGHVLSVSLAVALIVLAALVPLALLVGLLALGGRGWRRQRRERVLDAS
jgi:hypothetical protein